MRRTNILIVEDEPLISEMIADVLCDKGFDVHAVADGESALRYLDDGPEVDVLFHGNRYTDYHAALQSAGPSPGSSSIAPTLTSMSGMPDATSLTHVDAPVANTATAATVQHPDVLLAHIATTLDDLGLHSHTH